MSSWASSDQYAPYTVFENRAKLFKILAWTFSKNRLSIKSLWEAYFIETLLKLLESAVFQISKNASQIIKRGDWIGKNRGNARRLQVVTLVPVIEIEIGSEKL